MQRSLGTRGTSFARPGRFGAACGAVLCVAMLVACRKATSDDGDAPTVATTASKKVGYDLRRLRPRNDEPLAKMFERMREQALGEEKVVAILFSADWCEPCRRLDLELGNMHPASDIGHVRILEIKEEEWEAVTRINEVNDLRRRWSAPLDSYPVLIVLDQDGEKVEEMKDAIERLEASNLDPTLPAWLREHRPEARG
jgi:thiol-disulfide isomerase/thioredoxin